MRGRTRIDNPKSFTFSASPAQVQAVSANLDDLAQRSGLPKSAIARLLLVTADWTTLARAIEAQGNTLSVL